MGKDLESKGLVWKDVSRECWRDSRMGISAAECGHWRTLFSHNYHFKWATWDSPGKCRGELTCITSGFNLKVFQSRKARDQIKVPRLMKPEASLQEMLCWNLLFSGGLGWSFKVGVADLHSGNYQPTAVVHTSPVSAQHSDHSPFLAGLTVSTCFFNEWPYSLKST